METKKGFVLIIVLAFLAVVSLMAGVIIYIGVNELSQATRRNDFERAYYLAISGAQMQYLYYIKQGTSDLAEQEVLIDTVDGKQVKGYFNPRAYPLEQDGEVDIVSVGCVNKGAFNECRVTMVVKYYQSPSIASPGMITMTGHKTLIFISRVTVNESVGSNTGINPIQYVSLPEYRKVANPDLTALSYWIDASDPYNVKALYDTNGNGARITDQNTDGTITIDDAILQGQGDPILIEQCKSIFRADNPYHPGGGEEYGAIDDLDAFYEYYTHDLNYKDPSHPLQVAPGELNYYQGDQTFDPWFHPNNKEITFVDGNVTIWFSDENWSGDPKDHTIVSTKNIAVNYLTNRASDRLTLIAYGNVTFDYGISFLQVNGDVVVQAGGNFIAKYGGQTNGTMFANTGITVDTIGSIGLIFNRILNNEKFDRSDPDQIPLGLHPDYPKPRQSLWQRP
ncbi:MAG: hypothetical protein PHP46_00105 [Candidatus Omnitrophica bacterium]|nr:hypothetical protein [Candidatus Omnitrophota bacterium]